MSPKSHCSAGFLRPAAWSGALALLLLAADAGGEGVTLRLDRTLSQHGPQAVDEGTAILLRFGSGEIRQQIQLTRERISRLERTNQELAAAVSSGDELMSALKELQGLQDQVQKGVREAVDARADAAAAATARPAPDAAAQPVEAPAVRPATTPRVRTAPAPVEAPAFEIPIAGLPQWAVAAALGVIILALLGWMAMRFLGRARGGVQMPEPARAPHPVEFTRAPVTPTDETAGTDTLADDTVDLDADPGVDLEQADPAPAAQSQPVRPPVESEERWSNTLISRKAADPQALREVDTLIAFEQYEKAKALLDEMLVADPDNPELVLRHYHVRTQGGIETTDDDEALLRAMMDGPLSDTMLRVRNLGRGLMPGDPLFDDPAKRAAASHALKESKRGEVEADDAPETADDDTVVQFTGTVKLERSPLAGN